MTCVTSVDWPAVGSILQGIGTVGGAAAVFIAAKLGANSFENWRQQKLSERRIEQAERILTATYKVRRGLSMVRSPAMWGHELQEAEDSLKTSGEWDKIWGGEPAQKKMCTTQAYYNRLNRTRADQSALEECQPMARALFGEDLEKALEKLNHQFWTFQVYVDANQQDRTGADAMFLRTIDSAIWEGYPSAEENVVDQIIAAQVKLIEDICVPVLRLEIEKVKRPAVEQERRG